jgi:PAS domain S-box-containing protein
MECEMEENGDKRTLDQHALAYAENIIATLREPFVVLDKSLRVRTANAAFYRDFHVSKEETEGRFVYDSGDGKWDIPQLRTLLPQALSNSDLVENFEVEHAFPALGRRNMLLNARKFPHESNDPDLVLLAIEDITARKKAEEEVRQSEEKFRLLVEGVQDYAIFMLDVNGTVVGWNAGAERIKGYRAEEIVGKHFSCFYPKESVETGWPERELKTATTEGRFEDEGWRLRKDGSTFWANVVITSLRDKAGNLKGFSKITRDLTDRRRAEAALKDSEVRYRRLFQTAKDGILILDAGTGKVIDANPFMTTLLGYSHDEFLRKELWEIGLFRDIEESRAAYRELQEKGYVRYENLSLESRSGLKVEVEFVSNIYVEGQRQVVQCNIRDITERSRLQRLTQEQATVLADLKCRRQQSEAVGRLAGGVAHAFNNLMTMVIGHSEIMLDGMKPGDTFFVSAQAIKKFAKRTATLTQNLLAFSRKQLLTLRRVDLNAVVSGLARVVQNMQGGVRLGLSLEPWLRPTRTDPDRLEEAILTLVRNACEAMPLGGLVAIQTANVELGQDYTHDRPEVQPGPYVLLAVSDTGVGMDQEAISHMFEPFYTKEAGVGAGMGLAAVYGLVKQCGGDIEVRSQPNMGTTFRLYLPSEQGGSEGDKLSP